MERSTFSDGLCWCCQLPGAGYKVGAAAGRCHEFYPRDGEQQKYLMWCNKNIWCDAQRNWIQDKPLCPAADRVNCRSSCLRWHIFGENRRLEDEMEVLLLWQVSLDTSHRLKHHQAWQYVTSDRVPVWNKIDFKTFSIYKSWVGERWLINFASNHIIFCTSLLCFFSPALHKWIFGGDNVNDGPDISE